MKKIGLLLALLCLFSAFSAEKVAPMSYNFTPVTWKGQAAFADDQCNKLTDGQLKPPSRAIWNVKSYQYRPVTLNFQFGNPVNLNAVRLYYQRGQKSYGIKQIKISGRSGDASWRPIGGEMLKQSYELPKTITPWSVENLKLPLTISNAVDQVKIEIFAVGSYIALTEVEFFGAVKPIKPQNPATASTFNPWLKFANTRATGLQLQVKKDYAVLENDQVVYVLDPVNSGVVNFAYDKTSRVNLLKVAQGNTYGGMFQDRFWPGNSILRDSYLGQRYQLKVLEDSPQQKRVMLSGVGKAGIFANVTIEKIFTLKANSPILHVDYKVLNDQANVVPLKHGLWIAGGVACDRAFQLVYPGAYQIEKAPVKVQSLFLPGAVAGWFAALDGRGAGLGLICDYSRFKSFYMWSNNDRETTMECRLGIYEIPANDHLKTAFALAPFNGITCPDGINTIMAGGLNLPTQIANRELSFQLQLQIFKPGTYQFELRHGRLMRNKLNFRTVEKWSSSAPHFTRNFKIPVQRGTQVVQLRAYQHGKICFQMENSAICKTSSGLHARPYECARRPESGVKKQALQLNFNSTKITTPHLKWAKPWSGKKPKVLAICFHKGGIRDMIELAQRFDIDLTTNYVGGIWKLSGHCTSLSESDCFNALAQQLKKDFDVIVVSSRIWGKMPKLVSDQIVAKVQQGTGLILVAPEQHPRALQKIAQPRSKFNHFIGKWQKVANHPLVSGIPFEVLPPTRALPYQTSGQVLAQVGSAPLLSLNKFGKGQVATVFYAVDGRNRGAYHQRYADPVFLPLMLFNEPRECHFDYWEYQLSWFAKMIYYCANSQSGVTGGTLKVASGQVQLELTSDCDREVAVEIIRRNKFGAVEAQQQQSVKLNAGRKVYQFAVPGQPVMHGTQLVDIRIRERGKVCYWGSGSFENTATSHITQIQLPEKIWRKSELLKGAVKLSAPGKLRVSLWDNCGNELARSAASQFTLPLANCRTLSAELQVELLNDERQVVDKATRYLNIYGAPDARRLQIIFGWPILSQRGMQSFLLRPYFEKLMELGANAVISYPSDTLSELRTVRQLNLPFLGAPTPESSGGKFPFDRNVKPRNKFDLIRLPCLSRPGFQDKLEQGSNQITRLEKYGVLFRSGPDEANSVTNWSGCFSKDCQREFRVWLKKQYGTLAALNASWQSNYQNWSDVIAATADEVKGKNSVAPWLDHRTFNDENRANAIGRIVKGMKKANPHQRYALSGTQETKAFNAWDWYLLMNHLEALQSYGGEQTIQQRCFSNKKLIWQTWIGYDSALADLQPQIHYNLMQGATGFSVYSGDFYVNPDFTLPPRARELQKALQTYLNGPAEALIAAKFYSYPIAFYYSPSSIKVNWITDRQDRYTSAVGGFKLLLQNMGLGYDYVASAQVAQTPEVLNSYKILVLPTISALSQREIAAIKNFVRRGGLVIADQFTGVYDEHGKKWAEPPLAELFGFKASFPTPVSGKAEVKTPKQTVFSLPMPAMRLKVASFEKVGQLSTAKSLGALTYQGQKMPIIWSNNYGKGRTLYLGCALPNTLADWRELLFTPGNQAAFRPIKQFFQQLLHQQGIRPLAQLPSLPEASLSARYNNTVKLLGISCPAQLPLTGKHPQKHTVKFDQNYYVYDLLQGRFLGHGASLKAQFAPGTQAVWSLLPYEVGKLQLRLQRTGKVNKLTVTLPGVPKNGADHIFKVKLLDSKGQSNRALSGMIWGERGTGSYQFELPLNRVPGAWTIQVTEVMTGQKAQLSWR